MPGQFNYIVFVLRTLVALCWSALVIASFFFLPGYLSARHELSGVIGALVAWAAVTGLMGFKFWRAIWTERFSMGFSEQGLMIRDRLLFTARMLRLDEIKGFSLSAYPIRVKNVKSILLYLKDGGKIEFPQFLFFGFKRMVGELEDGGVRFLGEEPFIWKWVDSREYKFDE